MTRVKIKELIGKIFSSVVSENDDELTFTEKDTGIRYQFEHDQDCCESVSIEDIIGDLNDLVDTPIIIAEERIEKSRQDYSFTWTFYTFRTIKGTVTVRWYGESNGYHSENVDLFKYES